MLIGIHVVRRGDGRFAIIAIGHIIFAADRMLGAQELKRAPRICCGAADGKSFKYADMAMLPGAANPVFVMSVIDSVPVP